MNIIQMGWVLAPKMEELKGIKVGALNKMKERGKLKEGYHFKKFNGRLYFHFERFDELINDAA